jgi:hypothetical protein
MSSTVGCSGSKISISKDECVAEYIYRNGPVTKKVLIEFSQQNGKPIQAGTPPEGLPFITDYLGFAR